MAQGDPLIELIQRAMTALQRNAWTEAEDLAQAALKGWGPEANALMIVGSVRSAHGDPEAAIALYEQARALNPAHIHVLVNLAAAYRATGRLPAARHTLEQAVRAEPRFAIAHNNLGNVLMDLGEPALARQAYERAAALDEAYPNPLAGLARIAEAEHRLEDARRLAAQALKLAPQDVLAALTLARVALREGDAAASAAILERLLRAGPLSPNYRILVQGALGEACDRLSRYDEAYAAFMQANELQHQQCAPAYAHESGPLSPAGIARLIAFVAGADPAAWRSAPVATRSPVFLVGFPRSGTTLLDQILASHPEVSTLEEADTLVDAMGELMGRAAAFSRWAQLPDADIERLRGLYWHRVNAAGGAPAARVFVDKQPMNAVMLPLIHRLFPAARILLALRDPRDAVLSCFQQRFGMNAAMFQLLRLDTAAAYYDQVMHLVAVSRERLPLRLHAVRYEDVVSDFETTARAVLAFLDLGWDEGVRRFSETAMRRSIATPSAAQVVRPLYASARGKWRNYAAHLAPHLQVLSPWVRAFGYEAD